MEIYMYAGIALAINLLMYAIAFKLKTDKLTDISYAITFITVISIAFILTEITLTKIVLLVMVLLWGIRLGAFLLIRISKAKKDKRFDGIRESPLAFLTFWVSQGFIAWVLLLPALFFMYSDRPYGALIGLAVWILGFSIETIADLQKYRFKQNTKNKGKFIQSGLWKYSRHPNYFGEICCWIGIFLYTLPALTPVQIAFALISPLSIIFVLVWFTGIPPLEKSADKKWGHLASYQRYKSQTSILVPWFKIKGQEPQKNKTI
ncbi:MAG: DUF1295 domain-containing protein [Candidatus Woesearchaeota archaeon]